MQKLSGRHVVHAAAMSGDRFLCRPNVDRVILFPVAEREQASVTCGLCLRAIAKAEREAHQVAKLLADAVADAERVDASTSGNPFQSVGTEDLTRSRWDDQRALSKALRTGNVRAAASWAYVLRVTELELAHRARVADVEQARTEALAEHHSRGFQVLGTLQYAQEMHRRNEAIANGRADAVRHGQDTPMFNTSVVDFAKLAQRLEEHRAEMVQWLAVQGPLQTGELWALGYAAFDHQRNLDTLHLRVLGLCPGCARRPGEGWTHASGCPAGHLGGVPAFTSAEGIQTFWMRPADPRGLLV